jgi:hypothetical protein
MSAPNIVNASTILGKTAALSLGNTSQTVLLTNAASSSKVLKINNIIISNDDGSSSADITISYHDAAAGGGTAFKVAHTVAVAEDSTLVLLDKTSGIYLEEDTSISATASVGGDLDVICSYEEIS